MINLQPAASFPLVPPPNAGPIEGPIYVGEWFIWQPGHPKDLPWVGFRCGLFDVSEKDGESWVMVRDTQGGLIRMKESYFREACFREQPDTVVGTYSEVPYPCKL